MVREAAKKILMTVPSPLLSSFMAVEKILKLPETDFFIFFYSPPNFWTKRILIFGKYCNNLVKIPTDKRGRYVDKLS